MVELSRVAQPRTREELEELAWRARGSLGLFPDEYVPMVQLIEHVLPNLIDGFEMRVAEQDKLGPAEAITHESRPIITFSERTYEALCQDRPRPRMTAAHELGHLLLHTGQSAYAFTRRYDARVDPERQADIFAAAFLMPECAFLRVRSIEEAMKKFGVTRDAATCRARTLRMWHLVNRKPDTSRPKKKGTSKRPTP